MPFDPVHAKKIFEDALDLPLEHRVDFLVTACGDDRSLRAHVDSLLYAYDEAGEFLQEAETLPQEELESAVLDAPGVEERSGSMIGRYKLIQKIGEGGFGTVWRAVQEQPVHREVALKVIKLGMDTKKVVARFEAERQALAMMNHPNIAKVLDGGMTPSGRPFFVMDLVDGVPITQYCDDARLSTTERLELFQQVCHAVQHAHQKGIIHRDLKPSNIMVTLHGRRPAPRIIDFGIAKATSTELTQRTVFTESNQLIGTPEYMAPEQAASSGIDIDTRADVYSLGVLLYELLTGTKPFDSRELLEKGYLEMMRVIREEEPAIPSARVTTKAEELSLAARQRHSTPKTLSRLIRGDLDWIVMKTLEKDRNRRYATASEIADDIEHHLLDEPVKAGPPSRGYRLRKYFRRHRVGTIAGGIVACAILAGLGAATWGFLEARGQRDLAKAAERVANAQRHAATTALKAAEDEKIRANKERKLALAEEARAKAEEEKAKVEALRANTVMDLFTGMLEHVNPELTGRKDYMMSEALDNFERYLGDRLAEQPDVDATIQSVLGKIYADLGRFVSAKKHFQRALVLAQRLHGEGSTEEARSLINIGGILSNQGKHKEAEELLRKSLAILRGGPDADSNSMCNCLNNLGAILKARREFPEAERYMSKAIVLMRKIKHEDLGRTLMNLGTVLGDQGKFKAAEDNLREALDVNQKQHGLSHPLVALNLMNLAIVYQGQLKYSAAESYADKAYEMMKRFFDESHPRVLETQSGLAAALEKGGQSERASELARRGLALARKSLPEGHRTIATFLRALGGSLADLGMTDQAEGYFKEALDVYRKLFGNDSRMVLNLRISRVIKLFLRQRRF